MVSGDLPGPGSNHSKSDDPIDTGKRQSTASSFRLSDITRIASATSHCYTSAISRITYRPKSELASREASNDATGPKSPSASTPKDQTVNQNPHNTSSVDPMCKAGAEDEMPHGRVTLSMVVFNLCNATL
eukprot:4363438-Pyramimonas_sp.AAC.1